MRKIGLFIVLFGWLYLSAANSIDIPLKMSVVRFMPLDKPTGSTPDPTDPNQFHATLTGNTLTIKTQNNEVSYVVIRSNFSEKKGEDYFYSLSFDSVSCPITRPGLYRICIGYWNTDFVGVLNVKSVILSDFNGKILDASTPVTDLPRGFYFVCLETNIGVTTQKILRL